MAGAPAQWDTAARTWLRSLKDDTPSSQINSDSVASAFSIAIELLRQAVDTAFQFSDSDGVSITRVASFMAALEFTVQVSIAQRAPKGTFASPASTQSLRRLPRACSLIAETSKRLHEGQPPSRFPSWGGTVLDICEAGALHDLLPARLRHACVTAFVKGMWCLESASASARVLPDTVRAVCDRLPLHVLVPALFDCWRQTMPGMERRNRV